MRVCRRFMAPRKRELVGLLRCDLHHKNRVEWKYAASWRRYGPHFKDEMRRPTGRIFQLKLKSS
jgi:hypothetical protein